MLAHTNTGTPPQIPIFLPEHAFSGRLLCPPNAVSNWFSDLHVKLRQEEIVTRFSYPPPHRGEPVTPSQVALNRSSFTRTSFGSSQLTPGRETKQKKNTKAAQQCPLPMRQVLRRRYSLPSRVKATRRLAIPGADIPSLGCAPRGDLAPLPSKK